MPKRLVTCLFERLGITKTDPARDTVRMSGRSRIVVDRGANGLELQIAGIAAQVDMNLTDMLV